MYTGKLISSLQEIVASVQVCQATDDCDSLAKTKRDGVPMCKAHADDFDWIQSGEGSAEHAQQEAIRGDFK